MKQLALAILITSPAVVVYLITSVGGREDGRSPRVDSRPVAAEDLLARAYAERLDQRLADAEERIARLRREQESLKAALSEAMAREGGQGGPDALDQYVLSFQSGSGSEYYRLAVEAHAPAWIDRIIELVSSKDAAPNLRVALARILGDSRFAGDRTAIQTLLGLLRPGESHNLQTMALTGIGRIGGAAEAIALERALWDMKDSQLLRTQAVKLIAKLSGPLANERIEGLLRNARSDVERVQLLKHVDRSRPASAVRVLSAANGLSAVARAAAAKAASRMRGPEVGRFIDDRLQVEQDKFVRAELERAKNAQTNIPNWHALQATGKPNANPPNRDHPRAWATRTGAMGLQWIELTYKTPMRADRVRIFEVNSPGAVVEVQTVDAAGKRRTVWQGRDRTTQAGVFEVKFAPTPYRVRRVRVILNTNVTPTWNEIDAVELVGPDGRAWASGAVASSNFGQ